MTQLLIESALRGALVLLAAFVALGIFRGRSAAFRHGVLACAFVLVGGMPFLMQVAPRWSPPRSGTGSVAVVLGQSVSVPIEGAVAASRPRLDGMRGRELAFFIWGAGFLASLVSLGAGFWRLRGISGRARDLDDAAWTEEISEFAGRYGLRRRVRMVEAQEASLLMTWGLWRPTLVLPRGARLWPRSRVRAVLGHELAHVRRRDWAWQLLGEGARAVYWFNPLVWLACRRLREEGERAADDVAIRSGINGRDYASELIEMARLLGGRRVPALAFAARSSAFERRVGASLHPSLDRRPLARRTGQVLFATFLVFGMLAAGCGAARQSALGPSSGRSGSVFGVVTDVTGSIIPGVGVSIARLEEDGTDADEQLLITNREGTYRFEGVAPGTYRFRARLPGFQTAEKLIYLPPSQSLVEDVRLEIRVGEEAVEVVAERPATVAPAPAAGEDAPVRFGGNVAEGQLLDPVAPVYPQALREAGVEGVAVVEATIGADGVVRAIRPISGHPGLVRAVTDAVATWRYRPYILNDEPTATTTRVVVNFSLR